MVIIRKNEVYEKNEYLMSSFCVRHFYFLMNMFIRKRKNYRTYLKDSCKLKEDFLKFQA